MKKPWFLKRSGIWLLAAVSIAIWGLNIILTLPQMSSVPSLPTLASSPQVSSLSSDSNTQPTPLSPVLVEEETVANTAIPLTVADEAEAPETDSSEGINQPIPTQVLATEVISAPETTVRVIGEPIIQLPPSKPVPNTAVLRFQPGTAAAEQQAYLTSIGATIQQDITLLNTVTVLLPNGSTADTLPDSQVLSAAEPDYYVSAQMDFPSRDPRFAEQWALDAVHLDVAWKRLPTEVTPVIVAVIDSGICASHPDLVGRVLVGYDFVQDDADPTDTFGHGCAVSGLIAANVDNEIGIAGMAPNVNLLPLRVLDGQGLGTYSDVSAAILYAVQHGAKVLNLSLGGTQSSQVLQDAIVYAQQQGVIIVAAAGNSSRSGSLYPGAYEGVYSVGSVDADQQRSSFSNYGPTVRLYAPGRDLLTIGLDGTYQFVTGTSFAAPLVSAAAALHSSVGGSLPLDGSVLDLTSLSVFAPVTPTAAPASATPSDTGETQALTGWLSVIHGDPEPDSTTPATFDVLLHTDDGKTYELFQAPPNIIEYHREYVSVTGSVQAQAQSDSLSLADYIVAVSDIVNIGAEAQAVTGSKPYVNIMCRFSDSTGTTPQPVSFYQNMMLGGYPSLDHYWRAMSYDAMNIAGSQSYGWFNLSRPRSYYVAADNSSLNTTQLAIDCTNAANATVNFSAFFGINMMFNQALDGTARGGSSYLTLDGPSRLIATTWLPVGWGQTHHVIAHEMGHAFGLPHSSGPAHNPFSDMAIYVAHWDVMSRSGGTQAVCLPNFGCLGPGTIAYYHDMLGWLGSRQVSVATGSSGSYTLDRLDSPDTGVNPLMVRIPINNSATHFYTVEARDQFNEDQNIPDHTVIIYDVDLNRSIPNAGPALIIDNDTNRNVNDEGAMWRVNETFLDAANNISVTVTGTSGTGFTVQVNNNTATPPAMPTGLTITATTAFSASLSWQDKSANETGFRIFRRISPASFAELTTVGANVTSFMDVTAACNTTYEYRVTSYNGSGQSAQSNTATTTTLVCPPGNDSPQTAYTIGASLPYSFTQTNVQTSTVSASEPAATCIGSGERFYSYTVWYKWTPSVPQNIEISTVDAATNYDTVLALYQGTPTALTQIGCNDDATNYASNKSWISATVSAGTTYYVMVARWSTTTTAGPLTVNLALRTERFKPTTTAQLITSITQANGSAQFDLIELVSGATYTLTTAYDSENAFPPITSNLSIFPNGAAHAIITRSPTAPSMRFFNVPSGNYLSLSSVKLTKGRLLGANAAGGAIYNSGSLDLWNVEFLDNEASWGGALTSWGTLYGGRVTFARNKAINNGGGVDMASGTAYLYDSVFLGNQGGWGGGFINWGTSTLIRVRFADNRATNAGGALNNLGTLTYQSGTVNSGAAPFAAGFSNQGKATLSNIRFVYNVSTFGAAINTFDSSGSDKEFSAQSLGTEDRLVQSTSPLVSPGAVQGQSGGQVELTLNAVMIENNYGSYGPALRNSRGQVTLNGTTIRNHNAYEGAITNWDGTLIFNGGRVENNTSVVNGGALYNLGGTVTVSNNSLWSSNKSQVGSGGAIANYGLVTLNTASFQSNTAGANGGAVLNAINATLTVNGTSFTSNSTYYQGGAIFNAGSASLSNGYIASNIASEGGGGVSNVNGGLNVSVMTFEGNITDGYGGAVWHHANSEGSFATVSSSAFYENRASWGGGIYGAAEDWGGGRPTTSLNLIGNRFHYNTALQSAGAIGLEYASASVTDGCISANTTGGMISLVNVGPQVTATGNWWGGPNGPNAADSDTTSGAVDVTTYNSSAPINCGVANDHYTTAYPISSLPYAYVESTIRADRMVSEPKVSSTCVANPSNVWNVVWWSYQTAESGQTIDFDTLGSNYNTVLAVWKLEANGALTSVACDDDTPSNTQSTVRVAIQPNQTYYVMVGSSGVGGGSTTLNARFVAPGNDDFGTPITVVTRPYSSVIHTGGATQHVDDPDSSCAVMFNTVWYRYTPTTSGLQVFTTDGSTQDTVMGIYTGTRFTLQEQACNDDALDTLTSRIEMFVTAGQTYSIIIGSTSPGGGSLRFGVPQTLGTPTLIAPSTPTTTLARPVFTWSAVAGAVRYDIQVDVNDPPTSAPIRVTTATFTPAIPLLPRPYYWRVRAVDAQGYGSGWSAVRTLIVTTPAGQAPTRNYFQVATPVLSWTRTSSATAYEIQVDTINTFTSPDYQTIIDDVFTLEVTTTALPNGVYYWRVRARQPNGAWGAWSLVDSFTVDIP